MRADGLSFFRPDTYSDLYYYEAIQIIVNISGSYALTSTTGSLTKTVGYLYNSSFDLKRPRTNLIAYDTEFRAGNGRFLINSILSSGVTYILVVTTFDSMDYGTYGVTGSGIGWTTFTSLTAFTGKKAKTVDHIYVDEISFFSNLFW